MAVMIAEPECAGIEDDGSGVKLPTNGIMTCLPVCIKTDTGSASSTHDSVQGSIAHQFWFKFARQRKLHAFWVAGSVNGNSYLLQWGGLECVSHTETSDSFHKSHAQPLNHHKRATTNLDLLLRVTDERSDLRPHATELCQAIHAASDHHTAPPSSVHELFEAIIQEGAHRSRRGHRAT